MLSRRDYTVHQVKSKLQSKDFTSEEIEQLIKLAIEHGWLNEQRFIENYIHYRSQRGIGPKRIQFELAQKGINLSQLKEISNDQWRTNLKIVLQKKYGSTQLARDAKERAKQLRFLYGRGFTYEQIQSVLE